MSLHTFPTYITTDAGEIEVTVSIDHYHPGTPDTWNGPGDDEELNWHFINDDGTNAPHLHAVLSRDDAERIDAECVREMTGVIDNNKDEAAIDRWIDNQDY